MSSDHSKGTEHTAVPYCRSNLSHHAQQSPLSPSFVSLPSRSFPLILMARMNHSLAFSTFPSAQNTRATLHTTQASSLAFLRASTPLAFRAGRGSAQIDKDKSIPEVGHSCNPVDIESVSVHINQNNRTADLSPRDFWPELGHLNVLRRQSLPPISSHSPD
jgi:hypothetical protein